MNRYQYDNIDPMITSAQRERALKWSANIRSRKANSKPTGYDEWAGKRLVARRRSFDAMASSAQSSQTRPGSMRRPS